MAIDVMRIRLSWLVVGLMAEKNNGMPTKKAKYATIEQNHSAARLESPVLFINC